MNLKKIITLSTCIFMLSGISAFAKDFGVVDVQKVIKNYTKAQNVISQVKINEAEVQRFLAEAQKKLKAEKNPAAQKKLKEQLSKQLQQKQKGYKQDYITKWTSVQNTIRAAIQKSATVNNVDAVLDKNSIIIGGKDLTQSVISNLK